MKKQLDVIRKIRQVFLNLVNELSIEQLNKIPTGFNNNIAWNFGHIVCAQQTLCYKLAGAPLLIDDKYIAKYTKGTKPETFIEKEEIELMKQYLFSFIDQLEADIETHIFNNYQTYTTLYGIELTNVNDAIEMIISHDSIHLGVAMALKKLI